MVYDKVQGRKLALVRFQVFFEDRLPERESVCVLYLAVTWIHSMQTTDLESFLHAHQNVPHCECKLTNMPFCLQPPHIQQTTNNNII